MKIWINKICLQPFNYYLLIGALALKLLYYRSLGLRLDSMRGSTTWYGDGTLFLAEYGLLFTVISLILVLSSFFFKNKTVKLTFISLETLFWLHNLFLIQNAWFHACFPGTLPTISFLDVVALMMRFLVINSLLNTSVKKRYVLICVFVIVCAKLFVFPNSYYFG